MVNIIKEKCSKCGFSSYKGALHIHHKNGDHNDNIPPNLEVLCANCHFELHHKQHKFPIEREIWVMKQKKISAHQLKLQSLDDEILKLKTDIEFLTFQKEMFEKAYRKALQLITIFQEYVPKQVRAGAFAANILNGETIASV